MFQTAQQWSPSDIIKPLAAARSTASGVIAAAGLAVATSSIAIGSIVVAVAIVSAAWDGDGRATDPPDNQETGSHQKGSDNKMGKPLSRRPS